MQQWPQSCLQRTQPNKTILYAADTKLLAKAQTALLQVCILCCFVEEICFVCANDRVSDPDQDILHNTAVMSALDWQHVGVWPFDVKLTSVSTLKNLLYLLIFKNQYFLFASLSSPPLDADWPCISPLPSLYDPTV